MATALITGSSKRIGKSIALALAKAGFNIAIHYNTSQEEALQTQRELVSLGVRVKIFKKDLSKSRPEFLLKDVTAVFKDLELLVNNASIFTKNSLLKISQEDLSSIFQTNLFAPILLTKDFADYCSNGHIINISDSKIGHFPTDRVDYALTKNSLEYFTKTAAKALAPNFRVNAVSLGAVLPPQGEDEKYLQKIKKDLPLSETSSEQEINNAILFLVENKTVTGEIIKVDGGMHLL